MNELVISSKDISVNYAIQNKFQLKQTKKYVMDTYNCYSSGNRAFSDVKLEKYLRHLQFFPAEMVKTAIDLCTDEKPFFPELNEIMDKLNVIYYASKGKKLHTAEELWNMLTNNDMSDNHTTAYKSKEPYASLLYEEQRVIETIRHSYYVSNDDVKDHEILHKRLLKNYDEIINKKRREFVQNNILKAHGYDTAGADESPKYDAVIDLASIITTDGKKLRGVTLTDNAGNTVTSVYSRGTDGKLRVDVELVEYLAKLANVEIKNDYPYSKFERM